MRSFYRIFFFTMMIAIFIFPIIAIGGFNWDWRWFAIWSTDAIWYALWRSAEDGEIGKK